MSTHQTDVVVVGAGAAGLAAARGLHERRVDFLILEARERIGGRAYTIPSSDGAFPIELGAEFIHGEAPQTHALLRESGEAALQTAAADFVLRNGRLERGSDRWSAVERLFGSVDLGAPDRSVDALLEGARRSGYSDDELRTARTFIEGFEAAITSDAGSVALARQWRAGVDTSPSRPDGGYGPLLAFLAKPLGDRLRLNARVEEIRWSRSGAYVRAVGGEELVQIEARRVIVTAPVGVLHAGDLRFTPPLPARTRAALDAIAMGPVVKVMLEFESAFWETVDAGRFRDAGFFQAFECEIPTLWTRLPQRIPLLAAWAGGGAVARLEARGADAIAEALATCRSLFPSVDVRAKLRAVHMHDWQTDPLSRGAYSYLRVGGGDARDALALPVDDTLFFAGEATSADDPGTVEGALRSGERAVAQVL